MLLFSCVRPDALVTMQTGSHELGVIGSQRFFSPPSHNRWHSCLSALLPTYDGLLERPDAVPPRVGPRALLPSTIHLPPQSGGSGNSFLLIASRLDLVFFCCISRSEFLDQLMYARTLISGGLAYWFHLHWNSKYLVVAVVYDIHEVITNSCCVYGSVHQRAAHSAGSL